MKRKGKQMVPFKDIEQHIKDLEVIALYGPDKEAFVEYEINGKKIGFASYGFDNKVSLHEFYPLSKVSDKRSIGIGSLAFNRMWKKHIMDYPIASDMLFDIDTDVSDSFFSQLEAMGVYPEDLTGSRTLGYLVKMSDNYLAKKGLA